MPSKKKLTRKQWILYLTIFLLATLIILAVFLLTNDQRRFKKLTQELFISELSSNTLSLHYTLAWPESYGLDYEASLPAWQMQDEESSLSAARNALDALLEISPLRLRPEDAYAYGLLERYLRLQLSGESFAYYGEPLSPSSGMQSGLPILLADYTFRSAQDVEDYLTLLDQSDTYFEGLLQYEIEKSNRGLFMADYSAAKLVAQCDAIMDEELLADGSHFLHTTFAERVTELENQGLATKEQTELWLSENDRLLTTVMEPAYEKIGDTFILLQGTGTNDMGLFYFPQGQAYYEYLLASSTGSSRSIAEIKRMLFQDFQENYNSLTELARRYPQLIAGAPENSVFPLNTPEEMLEDLQEHMTMDFPAFPEANERFVPSYTVKSVSSAMEDYSSPAYYLTPPIDDMRNNIIYINHKNEPDALTLYTTLAHEGYPGHLYQTVYNQLYLNQQDASCVRYLLHYGGYVEGWAVYVENMSYRYAQALVQENSPLEAAWYEACRLNRNLQLGLYSLLDIAIHHEGATPLQVQNILKSIGISDLETVSAIYQYIVEEPGIYPKYYVGFLEFQDLKAQAEKKWGTNFSLQRFHQFVLETGPSDFVGLTEKLNAS